MVGPVDWTGQSDRHAIASLWFVPTCWAAVAVRPAPATSIRIRIRRVRTVPNFPRITVGDIVTVQRIGWPACLASTAGGLWWAALWGDNRCSTGVPGFQIHSTTCVIIASSARLSSQALGFDVIARNAIQTRSALRRWPVLRQDRIGPDTGLAIARMLGHITYLSGKAMEDKFDPDRHDPRRIASIFRTAVQASVPTWRTRVTSSPPALMPTAT